MDMSKIRETNFKNNPYYMGILEHVSSELGQKYLNLIKTDFPDLSDDHIIGFVQLNDTYGSPQKINYNLNITRQIQCSPTSLRYIYHAMTILDHYKKTGCKNICEVGCGYGGLCLAINYFSKILNVAIDNYNLIDLPEVCNLINAYLNVHSQHINATLSIHSSATYGENVSDDKLFFISNYCYTEIDQNHNYMYSNILLPKTSSGFIVWQNGGNNGSYPIENSSAIIGKPVLNIIEEKPQTDAGYSIYKNYFVYF